jgi:putative ABC transport system permease protein
VYYEASSQGATRPMWLVVRTHGDAMALAPAVRNAMRQLDADVPAARVSSMAEAVSESMALSRFRSLLMGVFAAAALLLAAVGIYGVTSFVVAQRTHEIGVRMALGGRRSQVVAQILREGMATALAGTVIGAAGAAVVGRALAGTVYGVEATNPLTFTAVAVSLLAAALVACAVPARRAASVDPMVALRDV